MRKIRLKKLEDTLGKKKELPIFLEKEGDYILFTDQLLKDLGENPGDYPFFEKPLPPEGYYQITQKGRKVSKTADFIDRIEGNEKTDTPEAYLYLKGSEGRMIIL